MLEGALFAKLTEFGFFSAVLIISSIKNNVFFFSSSFLIFMVILILYCLMFHWISFLGACCAIDGTTPRVLCFLSVILYAMLKWTACKIISFERTDRGQSSSSALGCKAVPLDGVREIVVVMLCHGLVEGEVDFCNGRVPRTPASRGDNPSAATSGHTGRSSSRVSRSRPAPITGPRYPPKQPVR